MAAKSSKKTKLRSKRKNIIPKSEQKKLQLPDDIPLWAPFLIFIIADLIFFYDQIFGKMYFWASFMSDFNELHIPFQVFVQESLKSFQLPFWNPYTFGGMPLLADIQVGFFYPLNFIISFFASQGELPVKAMEMQIIFHFFIAQVSMYFLCRHFKVSSIGSTIAALSYSLSGALVCRVVIQTFIYQFSWLPLLFLLFHKTITELKWKYAIITGLVLGVTMLVGHPQAIFYNGFFIGLFILWYGFAGVFSKELQGRKILLFAGAAVLPFVIAFGVSAIQVLHTQELASLSKRTLLTYKEAADGSLQIKQLLTMITPNLFGFTDMSMTKHVPYYLELRKGYHFWETAFYFGIPALIIGLIGIIKAHKSRLGAFLIFIALIGFFHALGSNGFLYALLFKFPFFDKFRFPARTIYYLVLVFSIFAGFGYDAFTKQKDKRRLTLISIAAGVPLLIALGIYSGVILDAIGTPQEFYSQIEGYGLTALCLIIAASVILFLSYKKKIPSIVAGLLLIGLIITDLTINLSGFKNHKDSPEKVFRINPNLERMLKPKPPDDIFRVKMRNKYVMPLRRNQGMVNKIMLLEGFNALQLVRKIPPCKAGMDLLSVRYQIKTNTKTRQSYFDERGDCFPHSRMVYKAVITSPDSAAAVVKSGRVDYVNETLLEKECPLELPQVNVSEVKNSVTCKEYNNNYQKYEVASEENGILNVSDIWYPAWKVKLDGQPAELLRINYCLRGIAIPAGVHTIEMYYDSTAFRIGLWITIFTLALTIGLLIFDWKIKSIG
ncbi:MAG: YfhO family protein [Calditrichales bacterium]|nr:YfhO family protein [Calditrichales bacterium]